MTNLQTIAESLNTKCKGQAWIIVTAQQAITEVVGDMTARQENDFSKIQARFANRMPLNSADVAEVIQRRLLSKTDAAQIMLGNLHDREENNLKTLFDFADGSIRLKNYRDRGHFVASYPFSPYQYTLFQMAITSLSQHNAFEGKGTGKSHIYSEFSPHGQLISEGEVTIPKLFVNNSNGRIGLVGYWDVVAFDEFAGREKTANKALVDIMKNYMANKSFSRGVNPMGAEASFSFVGNTDHNVPFMLKNSDLFEALPCQFHDSAFIDRLHAYLPGWEIDVIRGEMFTKGYGFDAALASDLGGRRGLGRRPAFRRLGLLARQCGGPRRLDLRHTDFAHDPAGDRHGILRPLWFDGRARHHPDAVRSHQLHRHRLPAWHPYPLATALHRRPAKRQLRLGACRR